MLCGDAVERQCARRCGARCGFADVGGRCEWLVRRDRAVGGRRSPVTGVLRENKGDSTRYGRESAMSKLLAGLDDWIVVIATRGR